MKRVLYWVGVVTGFVVLVAGVFLLFKHGQHWLAIHTGSDNESSSYYGFFSGISGNLLPSFGDIAILASIYAFYKHHQCEECWRPRKHTTKETGQNFCHLHFTHDLVKKHRLRHQRKYPNHIAHNPITVTDDNQG